jgi:hypothetical protein
MRSANRCVGIAPLCVGSSFLHRITQIYKGRGEGVSANNNTETTSLKMRVYSGEHTSASAAITLV